MNLLIDSLPTSVIVDEVEYQISYNFRTFILMEELMEEQELDDGTKLNLALDLFYGEGQVPDDIQLAASKLSEFYMGGSSPDIEEKPARGRPPRKIINYSHDHERIFTAFLRTYGINLATIENLHWYEFKAMFQDLDEDCLLSKVIGYRTVNLGEIKDKNRKKFYSDMKKKYELPVSKNARDELNRVRAILMGDGDFTKGR